LRYYIKINFNLYDKKLQERQYATNKIIAQTQHGGFYTELFQKYQMRKKRPVSFHNFSKLK